MKNQKQIFITYLIKNLESQIKWNKLSAQYEKSNYKEKHQLGLTAMNGFKRNMMCVVYLPMKIQEDLKLGHKLGIFTGDLYNKIKKTSSDICQYNLNTQYKQEIKELKESVVDYE